MKRSLEDTGDCTQTSKKQKNEPGEMIRIGVIGVGKLGSSLVEGFCSHSEFESHNCHLYLSPRGRSYVQKLEARFPDALDVCKSNQEVIDKSDVVMICVLPKQLPEVCGELISSNPEQILITCVSGHSITQIPSFFKECATSKVCKAIPLPASAFQQGTTLLFPELETPLKLFKRVGACFCPASEEEMAIYQGAGCTMGTLYKMMQTCQEWGESKGVDPAILQPYLAHVFQTFTFEGVHRLEEPRLFQTMVQEQTPGGLNEGVISDLQTEGFFDKLKLAMDRVEKRLSGAY